MKKPAASAVCMLGALCASALFAASKVTEGTIAMPTYPFSDPDPVPCTAEKRYPYFRYDGSTASAATQSWTCVTLENERVSVTMLPEIGGKVWGALDKATGREFIYFNHAVKFRDIAMRGPWCSGGIEFNFGIMGHAPTTATPVDWAVRQNPDGSASYFASATEHVNGTTWQVEVNLPADADYFLTRTTWFNGANLPGPYYHWMTAAYSARGNPSLAFPGTAYIGHGGDAHSWNLDWKGRDLSVYANNAFGPSKSYHVLNGDNRIFAVWWPEAAFGSYHYAAEKYGRKIWLWALSREGGIWEDLLTDTDGQYVELQSGRVFNQPGGTTWQTPFKHPTFAPGATDIFEERWGVVRDAAQLVSLTSGCAYVERPLQMPEDFDWTSAYGLYLRGQQALRERDDKTGEESLRACLAKEPNFVPALTALAGLDARRGDDAEVRALCARALAVDTYDAEANYLDGFAAHAQGAAEEARERLLLAAYSPLYRAPSYVLLAKGALRKGDWAAASDYAMKATQASSFNFDAWLVRIVAARRRGDATAARRILRLARQVAPLFHGARFEEKLIGDSDTAGFTFHVRNEFPEQTYLDLADWYEDAGLLDEARELYGLAPKNILAQVRRAYLERCAGNYEAAARALEEAAKLSVRFAFPFRRATRAALAWAAESGASWKFRYLLAVQRAAQGGTAEEVDALLSACDEADDAVVFHFRGLRRTGPARRVDLRRAASLEDGWRIGRDLARSYVDEKNWNAAANTAKDYLARHPGNSTLGMLYVKALCGQGRFDDAVKFLEGMHVLPSEHSNDAHALWLEAWAGVARQAMAGGDVAKADAALARRAEYPENLGRGKPYPKDE